MMISELVKRDDKQLNEALSKLGLKLDFTKEGKTKIVEVEQKDIRTQKQKKVK